MNNKIIIEQSAVLAFFLYIIYHHFIFNTGMNISADNSSHCGAGRRWPYPSRSTSVMELIGHSPSWFLRLHSSAERLFLALAGHDSPERTKPWTHIHDFQNDFEKKLGKILGGKGFVQWTPEGDALFKEAADNIQYQSKVWTHLLIQLNEKVTFGWYCILFRIYKMTWLLIKLLIKLVLAHLWPPL